MSYKYAGERDGVTYYKRNGTYYKRNPDSTSEYGAYVEVSCFWDQGMVTVSKNGKQFDVACNEVSVGDEVLTSGGFQTVIHVHLSSGAVTEVLKLETSSGSVLGVTQYHLVYDGEGRMKPAGKIRVGEYVQTRAGSCKIAKISKASTTVRSIITMNGELIVDDVRVSSYAGSEALGKALHVITAPIRCIASFDTKVASTLSKKCTPTIQRLIARYLSRSS
eukprot:CAMPEP_0197021832 /NCGR_PEP_ID=MMETSP1384-20130603/2729_1 /TAXON_ID=29189 /ORGANISM="Ammonia sp." /LENGTH=219 /DNA_ID=CAMNT_0042449743 /DNA_START=78 /DNA_END=737 /DNA_ORIENTATION=+